MSHAFGVRWTARKEKAIASSNHRRCGISRFASLRLPDRPRLGSSLRSIIWSPAPQSTCAICRRIRAFSSCSTMSRATSMSPARRLRSALRFAGQPGRLSETADPNAESRRARHAQRAGSGAGEKKPSIFLASTSECYGDPDVSPQPETYWGNVNPIGPRGVYDEAKRFAEAMTMAYHRYHGVDTHIVRIFNTYGPRMRLNDGRALPNFRLSGADRTTDHRLRRRQARRAASATSPI